MTALNIKDNSQLAANNNSAILEINGNSNTMKIIRSTGTIKINGNETCIYLGGELDQKTGDQISGNDLIYQIVEVVELLIILMIFYVIFNNIY